MNKLSKIAYAFILVITLFLLPVTYADSTVIVNCLKDGEKVSSAEAGSIVTVSAEVDNPTEGDTVTFDCANSTLSFIDEQTGKEYGEGEEVNKEVTILEDGTGEAEVSAKVLNDSQIEVSADVNPLVVEETTNPESKEDTTEDVAESESQDMVSETSQTTENNEEEDTAQVQDTENTTEAQEDASSTEAQAADTATTQTPEATTPETQESDNTTAESKDPANDQNAEQKASDTKDTEASSTADQTQTPEKTGEETLTITNIKSLTEQKTEDTSQDQSTIQTATKDQSDTTDTADQSATTDQADSTDKTDTADKSTASDQTATSEDDKTQDKSDQVQDTKDTESEDTSSKDSSQTQESDSDLGKQESEPGEEDDLKLTISTKTTSITPGSTIEVKASITPESRADLLENVTWTISYSEKEITPENNTGESISFEVPADASGSLITVSAYIPKDKAGTEDDIHAKNLTIGSQAENLSVEVYPSIEEKVVKPDTDLGFSSEILEDKDVADTELTEDAKYTWYAQIGSTYLNGKSFGSTYSVRPEEEGELSVWVSVELPNGTVIESLPVKLTVSSSDNVNLESVKVVLKNKPDTNYTGNQLIFTRELTPSNATNIEGAQFNWIAKFKDTEVAKSETEDNFTFTPFTEGDYSITLTITPVDGEPVVSEAYTATIVPKSDSDSEEPQQLIPEEQMKEEQKDTDKEAENKKDDQTTEDNKDSQNTSETEKSADKTDSNEKTESSSQPEIYTEPLKLTGAEIVPQNNQDNLEVGNNLVLDADIMTGGGSGEVTYHWTAIDGEGKTIATSNKLDNFTFTVDKPTDVTTIFEVATKDTENTPEQYRVARAEKVFSFKSPGSNEDTATALSASNFQRIDNPGTPAAPAQSAAPAAATENPVQPSTNTGSAVTATSANKTPSTESTTVKSTTNKSGSESRLPSFSSYLTTPRTTTNNSSSTKAVGQTPTQRTASSTPTSTPTSSTTQSTTPTTTPSATAITREPSLETYSTVDQLSQPDPVGDVTQGVRSLLTAPTGLIKPRSGDPFTVGEVGTVVLIIILIGCGAYSVYQSKNDDDSNDYYL